MDRLDIKLNEYFPGKVVRKDLLHEIKQTVNVPSFVLEFLLSRYCASDDPDEIEEGKKAVLQIIEKNYVKPDESNKAQAIVEQKKRHKFIDKIHVKYVEREKRYWAEMENFGSKRIAINPQFYQKNEKLLESGIWAEVTLAYNEVQEDDYAFYVEDLRPIQIARFDEQKLFEGRKGFTTDEWINVLIRSIGINPDWLAERSRSLKGDKDGKRLKFHILSRFIPLVQNNYNSIELGGRSTGKSYFYSEFSPYSTLLSGGQASTATLLYNNQRKQVGAVGFWDNVAFDEVANMKIKDADASQEGKEESDDEKEQSDNSEETSNETELDTEQDETSSQSSDDETTEEPAKEAESEKPSDEQASEESNDDAYDEEHSESNDHPFCSPSYREAIMTDGILVDDIFKVIDQLAETGECDLGTIIYHCESMRYAG